MIDGSGIGSKYEALSADARRAHGLSPTFWAYDELAQAKDRVLLDNLQTAMGKRKRSLGVVISTQAADDDHPLSQLIDDAQTNVDPSMVVHLLSAPADADPFRPGRDPRGQPGVRQVSRRGGRAGRGRAGAADAVVRECVSQSAAQPADCAARARPVDDADGVGARRCGDRRGDVSRMGGRCLAGWICRRRST